MKDAYIIHVLWRMTLFLPIAVGVYLVSPPAPEAQNVTQHPVGVGQVEWEEGRLSVVAEMTPLSEILREVSRRTGLEVRGLEGLQEKVSARFSGLSLREGLEKLLARVNYVLLEEISPQGRRQPALAWVFGRQATRLPEVIPSELAWPSGPPMQHDENPSPQSPPPSGVRGGVRGEPVENLPMGSLREGEGFQPLGSLRMDDAQLPTGSLRRNESQLPTGDLRTGSEAKPMGSLRSAEESLVVGSLREHEESLPTGSLRNESDNISPLASDPSIAPTRLKERRKRMSPR